MGAARARELLKERGYPEAFIEAVAHCIEAHSFSGGVEPRTLEAKVVSDADKLDAMGAIGIARAFLGQNRSIEETLEHFDRLLLEFYRRLKAELSEP